MAFTISEGDTVVLISKGVYKQVPVFIRDEAVFAKHGSGFIRLYDTFRTSVPTIRWEDLTLYSGRLKKDSFGRLSFAAGVTMPLLRE